MSELMLNIVCDPSKGGRSRGGGSKGNAKHKRFRGRIRYLERRGLLNQKQNKTQDKMKESKKNQDTNVQQKKKRTHEKTHLCESAVFPKFTSCLPNNTDGPSSSAQTVSKKPLFASTPCTSHLDPAHKVCRSLGPSKYLAMDCEMVGSGPKGSCNELARCSIVSYEGDLVYDKFIKPVNPVTDFRTRYSGIRRQDLVNALPFYQAQEEIVKIMKGKVVVGHAICNDFKAIRYFHPSCQTRDTSQIPLLNQKAGMPENQAVSLKKLTKLIFNKDIQTGKKGHSSVEDARATMELYKVVERMWEQKLSSQNLSAQAMDLAQTR